MSLNLGLESLGIVTDDVSLESVLMAETDFSDAQISLERACFIVATEARNVHNYNEIVDSLKRHSSQECTEFASDLLGRQVSVEELEKIPNTPEKVSLGGKLKGAWDAFVEWVKKAYAWCSKQVKAALNKLHILTARGFTGEVKVHYTKANLDDFVKAVGNANVNSALVRKPDIERILKLEFLATKSEKQKISLGTVAANEYFHALLAADGALVNFLQRTTNISGQATTKSADGKKITVTEENRNMINWYVMMMKRLKPFQKNIIKEVVMFNKRVFNTAYGNAKDMEKMGKKGKDGKELDADKVSTRFGGNKE